VVALPRGAERLTGSAARLTLHCPGRAEWRRAAFGLLIHSGGATEVRVKDIKLEVLTPGK
jgi:hypothetical protein